MAIVSDILNVSSLCSLAASIYTGKLGCQIEMGTIKHVLLFRVGFEIPNGTDITLDYILGEVQKGNIIPLTNAKELGIEGNDNSVNTDTFQVETRDLDGLMKVTATYKVGHAFYKQLAKLTSFGKYTVVLGDTAGTLNWAVTSTGITGFTLGQVDALPITPAVIGTNSEQKSVTMQMIDMDQYNNDFGRTERDQLGWHVKEVEGINEAVFSYDTAPVAGNTLVVKATQVGGSTPVSGLAEANFNLTIDGATDVIVSAVETASTGVYTITTTTAIAVNNVVVVSLFDGTVNASSVNLANVLWAGSVSATAA